MKLAMQWLNEVSDMPDDNETQLVQEAIRRSNQSASEHKRRWDIPYFFEYLHDIMELAPIEFQENLVELNYNQKF